MQSPLYTRRNFLKTSALAVGGLACPTALRSAFAEEQTAVTKKFEISLAA